MFRKRRRIITDTSRRRVITGLSRSFARIGTDHVAVRCRSRHRLCRFDTACFIN